MRATPPARSAAAKRRSKFYSNATGPPPDDDGPLAKDSAQTYFFIAPLFIPLFILGVPILDTLFAIVRRASRRQGVATADKGHLHHRLMNLGHGQRRSVLILWAWTALLSAFVLYPAFRRTGSPLVPIGSMAIILALYTVLRPRLRSRKEDPAKLPAQPGSPRL